MKSNKKLIIVITIVLALVVTGAVGAYLYMRTDVFKSNKELFAKYFSQNAETFEKIIDLQVVKSYEELKNENKYESNTDIKIVHSEGGEISSTLNNLSAKLDVQKNNDEQYMYANAQVLFENEKYLETEIIKELKQYGIKFSDVAKKFVTIQNDENIQAIANDIGINNSQTEILIDIAEKIKQKELNGQISILKDKYLNMITTGISNGTFEKQKNALITYNGVTTKTNAYSVQLTSEQVANILIEILNNAKSENEIFDKLQTVIDKETIVNLIDETIKKISEEIEIPSIKLVVYEQQQQTIRTVLEIGTYKITIENSEQNGKITSSISYLDSNKSTQYNVTLAKNRINNQEKMEVNINVTEGEEEFSIIAINNIQLLENAININTEISHKEDITTLSIILENQIKIGNDFEKKETLTADNNIILNNLEEETRKQFISQLKEKLKLLEEKILQINQTPNNTEGEEQMPQVEINKFNAKFEFYTGDEVSSENVKKLLDIVVNNFGDYEITEIDTGENNNANSKDKKINIKLNVEKDVINQEAINKVLENIKNNKKYKILIYYKEANGLIDYITITEI